nr:hypothetical protein [Nocardioides sp. B-3]
MPTPTTSRRSRAERREETIGRLLGRDRGGRRRSRLRPHDRRRGVRGGRAEPGRALPALPAPPGSPRRDR